jgi:hypothetical protein
MRLEARKHSRPTHIFERALSFAGEPAFVQDFVARLFLGRTGGTGA